MGTRPVRARGLELPWMGHERQRLPMLNVEASSEAHDAIRALVRRFDPDAIDVPGGSARIRLEASGDAWEVLRTKYDDENETLILAERGRDFLRRAMSR